MKRKTREGALAAVGPFTVRAGAQHGFIWRGEEFFQECLTVEGARALAALLNQAVSVAERHGTAIVSTREPGEIVAAALARAFDWRLELPGDRALRQGRDDGQA